MRGAHVAKGLANLDAVAHSTIRDVVGLHCTHRSDRLAQQCRRPMQDACISLTTAPRLVQGAASSR